MNETPGVWTVPVDYANRHPGKLRRFADSGGAVRIVDEAYAEPRIYWLTTTAPAWAEQVANDGEVIAEALHRERSLARRAAWRRRGQEVPA